MTGIGGWRDRNEKAGPLWYVKDGNVVSDPTPGNAGHQADSRDRCVCRSECITASMLLRRLWAAETVAGGGLKKRLFSGAKSHAGSYSSIAEWRSSVVIVGRKDNVAGSDPCKWAQPVYVADGNEPGEWGARRECECRFWRCERRQWSAGRRAPAELLQECLLAAKRFAAGVGHVPHRGDVASGFAG